MLTYNNVTKKWKKNNNFYDKILFFLLDKLLTIGDIMFMIETCRQKAD